MNKEFGSEGATKILKKAKLMDTFRNGGTSRGGNGGKVMLTDLCPEEKAKIGELVKTLENRKNENINLQSKINELLKN